MIADSQHKTGMRTRQAARPYCGTMNMAGGGKQNIGTLMAQIPDQRGHTGYDLKAAIAADQRKAKQSGVERHQSYMRRDCPPQ